MPMVSLYFWDPVCVLFLFWTDGQVRAFRLSIHVLLIPLSKWPLHLSIDHVYSKWQMKPNFKWRGVVCIVVFSKVTLGFEDHVLSQQFCCQS